MGLENDNIYECKKYTISDVAQILGVSERLVRKLCYDGKISHYKFGALIRITEHQLNEYINKSKNGGN